MSNFSEQTGRSQKLPKYQKIDYINTEDENKKQVSGTHRQNVQEFLFTPEAKQIANYGSPLSQDTKIDSSSRSKAELKASIQLLTQTATDLKQACLTLSTALVLKEQPTP